MSQSAPNTPPVEQAPPLCVAIQGELGSFSHEAALALLPQASILACAISSEVFTRLRSGEADCAVIPIENSLAGSVLEHYDLLLREPVVIEQEFLLRIQHTLIGPPGATLSGLRVVYSHPVALDQCRGFFEKNPHLRRSGFYDTAGSVKYVVEARDLSQAAIAGRQAARQYCGMLLAEALEDNPKNYTRFLLIRPGSSPLPAGGSSSGVMPPTVNVSLGAATPKKVSLCFAVENRPGSLVAALGTFAEQGANLTRLESRPVPGSPWQYIFYVDYEVEASSKADAILAGLGSYCSMVKELGRYQAASLP